jgi:hypothetical protein
VRGKTRAATAAAQTDRDKTAGHVDDAEAIRPSVHATSRDHEHSDGRCAY